MSACACPECDRPREPYSDMGTGETGYICETGCIQDDDVALDPEPWESNGNRYPVERHRAFGVADFSPRSEFNQDREAYR